MGMLDNIRKSFSKKDFIDSLKIVTCEELVNRCGTAKSNNKKKVKKVEKDYIVQFDPSFHEFLRSRPQTKVKDHRKRSTNYRYIMR